MASIHICRTVGWFLIVMFCADNENDTNNSNPNKNLFI